MHKKVSIHEGVPVPPLGKRKPFFGNALSLMGETPVQNLMRIIEETGDIFEIDIIGKKRVMISSQELADELSDPSRFCKQLSIPLQKIRALTADGLFTAENDEPNWQKAHNILMPGFSLQSMQNYIPFMYDIASQLVQRWENFEELIDVADHMTRLTFDTIGLAGFSMRFNSFYRETPHPFIRHMTVSLSEAMHRSHRPDFFTGMMLKTKKEFEKARKKQNDIVDEIIRQRMEEGDKNTSNDLLGLMLRGMDRNSGEKLDPLNIRHQVITFLIAGHETTSGLLSFALYFLIKHPGVMKRAREEVDRVLGGRFEMPGLKQINSLTYITRVIKETLRLWPTAPAYAVHPLEDTLLGNRYKVSRESSIMIFLPSLHRDKKVWGPEPEKFDPERFSPEIEQKRQKEFPNAYKPFGSGERACIGRQFAMTEAALVLGIILQRFDLEDPLDYNLKIKETLTLKPEGFFIRARKRPLRVMEERPREEEEKKSHTGQIKKHGTPLLVLYGSNLGTAEDMASRLAGEGDYWGFDVTSAPLDDYVNQLPAGGAVAIISSTYNGTPTDNARAFCEKLETGDLEGEEFKGVRFAVFGCGNTDWETFQFIPRLVDSKLANYGGKRLIPLGEGDANFDLYGTFDSWMEDLRKSLAREYNLDLDAGEGGKEELYTIDKVENRVPDILAENFGAREMEIIENRELYNGPDRSVLHVEIKLPGDLSFQAGDYLGVIPQNRKILIDRIIRHFKLEENEPVLLRQQRKGKTHLPVNTFVLPRELLSRYVELGEPVPGNQIKRLINYTQCPFTREKLKNLTAGEEYKKEILEKRKSLIGLLEEYPAVTLPFNLFLEFLPPLKPRYYSFSSSPGSIPGQGSITFVKSGTCSSFLAEKQPGEKIKAFIQPDKTFFKLPEDPSVPLIFIGAGTGIAPFRGFLQEREKMENPGKVLTFFGCRNEEIDFFYKEEWARLEEKGIARIYPAFSRPGTGEKKYVQDLLREKGEEVMEILDAGGILYLCGGAATIAPGVKEAVLDIHGKQTNVSRAESLKWLDRLVAQKRYRIDVWTS